MYKNIEQHNYVHYYQGSVTSFVKITHVSTEKQKYLGYQFGMIQYSILHEECLRTLPRRKHDQTKKCKRYESSDLLNLKQHMLTEFRQDWYYLGESVKKKMTSPKTYSKPETPPWKPSCSKRTVHYCSFPEFTGMTSPAGNREPVFTGIDI